jgi:hypothetical protein
VHGADICFCALQELGALMLKAGKPSEASKHLQQGLEMLVGGCRLISFQQQQQQQQHSMLVYV